MRILESGPAGSGYAGSRQTKSVELAPTPTTSNITGVGLPASGFREQAFRVRVVLLEGAHGQAFRVQRPDGVHGRRGARERRDARDLLHHGGPPHDLVVEERLAAKGRVDDHLDVVI